MQKLLAALPVTALWAMRIQWTAGGRAVRFVSYWYQLLERSRL